jgi:ankyrin repeat protein
MQTQFLKSLRKTGLLETGMLTAALLMFGSCIGVVHAHPRIAPLEALQAGDNTALRQLLDNGADVNTKDAEGTPLLMHAVLYADAEAVHMLLDRGADPNATNAAGATPLIWAAGDPAKAAMLIQAGADVNARSALGRTPLLVAATVDGASTVAHRLLAHGADDSVHDNLKGNPKLWTGGGSAPAIVEAAKARDGETLRLLLARHKHDLNFDIDAKDANGGTALSESVILANHENLIRLLAAGASVNIEVTADRYTPLMFAAMRDDAFAIALLIDSGADMNAVDASGNSALMWAAYAAEQGHSVAVDTLLRAGADVTIANRKGETALTLAGWHGKTHTYQRLSQYMRAVQQ